MRVTIYLTALLSSGAVALAQTNAPSKIPSNVRELSLRECITIALQQNFDIQISYYDPEQVRFQLAGTYRAYDPSLTMSGQHDYNNSTSGTESDANTLGARLGGTLPWGTYYSLGGDISDQTGTRPTLTTGTNYTRSPFESTDGNVGALTLSQPLLKNFWIDSPRLSIRTLKKEVKKSEADYSTVVMETVTLVESAYFKLVLAEENVKVQETALELAGRLVAENKKKVEVGAMAPLDEKQAESQAAASKADLIQAQAARDTAQRVLKNLLSDNYTNEWARVVVVPTEKLLALPQQFNLQESWRKGLAQGPYFRLIQLRLTDEQLAERVRYNKNQLYPQLDLIGSYGVSGSSKEYSGAFDQMARRDYTSWSFGAAMSVPLGRTGARNDLKESRAAKEQSALRVKQAEQKTLILIEDDIGSALSTFEKVDATRQARRFAEDALEAEQKKLENGKSTSFVVLQLQRDLTTARMSEISALADYNIALATLAFHEGSTLERRNISMDIK